MEPVRVDVWLWAVRVFKTRSASTEACRGGHVRVGDSVAKAATKVGPGDRVVARVHGVDRSLEVVDPIVKRVGAAQAATCLVDHTRPPPEGDTPFARARGAGRPTKRDRRQLDRVRR